MASAFSRQLKFAQTLVDSSARLTAESVLSGDFEYAKRVAHGFARAKKFRASSIWTDWKCSTFEIFCKKYSDYCLDHCLDVEV